MIPYQSASWAKSLIGDFKVTLANHSHIIKTMTGPRPCTVTPDDTAMGLDWISITNYWLGTPHHKTSQKIVFCRHVRLRFQGSLLSNVYILVISLFHFIYLFIYVICSSCYWYIFIVLCQLFNVSVMSNDFTGEIKGRSRYSVHDQAQLKPGNWYNLSEAYQYFIKLSLLKPDKIIIFNAFGTEGFRMLLA